MFLGLVPLVALWMGGRIGRRQGPARGVILAVLFVIVAAIPVALWSADRTARFGRLVIVSDKGPVTFALGFHRRASGTYDVTVIEPPSGIDYLREDPAGAAHLVAAKAGYFWGVLPDTWNVPRATPLWIHRASFGPDPDRGWWSRSPAAAGWSRRWSPRRSSCGVEGGSPSGGSCRCWCWRCARPTP